VCASCSDGAHATWRCQDCPMGTVKCRCCMRCSHQENPFHRIQRWVGSHFRPAELWEVGVYILVPHHLNHHICNTLKMQKQYLEAREMVRDDIEQEHGARGNQPRSDMFHNSYVRVVHTNGLHNLALVFCLCHGEDQLPIDLMASRIVPASFEQVKTVFTAQVLDHARLCNLELKSSTYQYYSLLKRLTSPMAPLDVVNLYNVFRRMLRLWRWMKKLKWAGYGNWIKDIGDIGEGGLVNFCVACPIEGVNLGEKWRDDPNRWAYRRTFVADGNFKADHVKPVKPSTDIWLSEGSGMDPVRGSYWSFLKTAFEKLTVTPCENMFRAIKNSLLASKACDITGKVAIACARHGWYAPAAMVDLYHGEQQKNVDFALLQAIKTTNVQPGQNILLIYDIACQYSIHLQSRIGDKLLEGMDIDYAIGLFHVHAHKDLCFFRYATTFIPGAAVVAGEILEPNWAELNKISPAAWTATTAHRSEIISDHGSDSNHKKCIGMTGALCKRIKEAETRSHETQEAYRSLTATLDSAQVKMWLDEVLLAKAQRSTNISAMDVYVPRVPSASAAGLGEERSSSDARSPVEVYMQFATLVEQKQ
ncbi:hypothetical protein CPC08DRAFT_646853, partial [Agrocybe pediades]